MPAPPLPRYGLGDRHPLGGRFLDPLHDNEDIAGYARVDGFRRLDEVDRHITAGIAKRKPTFFLVSGESGTGRSAAANYILAKYRELAQIAPAEYLVPKAHLGEDAQFISMRDDDWTRAIKNWTSATVNVLSSERQQWGVIDEVVNSLRSLRAIVDEDGFEADSGAAFQQLHRQLGPSRRFAVCIEDLKSPKIVEQALKIFGGCSTLCVFTALAAARENIIRLCEEHGQWSVLRLDALAGADAETLVAACWRRASQAPLPFAEGAITAAFERPRPLGRVLDLVHRALTVKEANTPGPGGWPEQRLLEYDADALIRTISALDGGG
jgi:hypothetical protein